MTFFIRHASIITKKLDLIRTPYLSSSAAFSITLQYISTPSSVSGYTFCFVSRSPTIFFLYSFFRVLLRRCTFLRPSHFHVNGVTQLLSFSILNVRMSTSMLWSYTRSLISLLLLFWAPYGFHVNAVIQLLQFFFPKQMSISIFWT